MSLHCEPDIRDRWSFVGLGSCIPAVIFDRGNNTRSVLPDWLLHLSVSAAAAAQTWTMWMFAEDAAGFHENGVADACRISHEN